MEGYSNHRRFKENLSSNQSNRKEFRGSQSNSDLLKLKKSKIFAENPTVSREILKNVKLYNKSVHDQHEKIEKAEPMEAIFKQFKKRKNTSQMSRTNHSSRKNSIQGASKIQKCRLTKTQGKNFSYQNCSSKRRQSQNNIQTKKPISSKSSFTSKKKSVSRVSTENYSKEISVESRKSTRFKEHKLKQRVGGFGTKGYSTMRSNVSVSPATKIKTYTESMKGRKTSKQLKNERSYQRTQKSSTIVGEEESNMRSPEREEILRNIQMTAFWICKNELKKNLQSSNLSKSRSSLFTFLEKHELKDDKERLERGYLLLNRKGRIIPAYKSEIKTEQTNVIAFWISGGKYPSPNTLSKELLKKVKSKLSDKMATGKGLCAKCVQKYSKLMNSNCDKISINSTYKVESTLSGSSEGYTNIHSKNSLLSQGNTQRTVYIFTLMRGGTARNTCSYCEISTKEGNAKPLCSSSSRRSRSRSNKGRKSSKHASKEAQRERINKEKPLCSKKTSFGQAIIRDNTDQENIPVNLLHNKKNIPNKSVREYKEMTGSEKCMNLDEIMNRKLHLNNGDKSPIDLDNKESQKASKNQKIDDIAIVPSSVPHSDFSKEKVAKKDQPLDCHLNDEYQENGRTYEEFTQLISKKSKSSLECIMNRDLIDKLTNCPIQSDLKVEVEKDELLKRENQNHLANICYSSSTPNSRNTIETTADRNPDSTSSDIASKDQKKKFENYNSIIPSPREQLNIIQPKPQSKHYRNPITTQNTGNGVTNNFCATKNSNPSINDKANFLSDSEPFTKHKRPEPVGLRTDSARSQAKSVNKLSIIHLKQKHSRRNSKTDASKFYQKHQQRRLHGGRPSSAIDNKQAKSETVRPGSRKQSSDKSSRLDFRKEHHRVPNLVNRVIAIKDIVIGKNQTLKVADTSLQSLGSISVINEAGASINPKNIKQHAIQDQDCISVPAEESCISGTSDSSNFLMVNPLNERASAYGFDNILRPTLN
ncbi:unnamed protein product [Moneuplotes crassus]|uniref:Uncharacterized protein n=1 Tax=Euplotes crassus TaxID=5936 RepID=A0AAD1XRR8_EUPCR|nr:unnamed protein product [Moneuplotes crassus]